MPSRPTEASAAVAALDHLAGHVGDDADLLAAAVAAEAAAAELHELARAFVLEARRGGTTWAAIGAAFGVTRQAALRRWRPPSPAEPKARRAVQRPPRELDYGSGIVCASKIVLGPTVVCERGSS